jgi:hypothetical protein
LLKLADINGRAGLLLAIAYVALSVLALAFGRSLAYASVDAFGLAAFLSGPIGFLLALASTPDTWTIKMVTYYVIGTLLLAPCLALSCHRSARVRGPSAMVAVLVWFATGFFALAACFAFAA